MQAKYACDQRKRTEGLGKTKIFRRWNKEKLLLKYLSTGLNDITRKQEARRWVDGEDSVHCRWGKPQGEPCS